MSDLTSSREPVPLRRRQLSVDGLHAALEMGARSSYVPSLLIGV
jgi:hypothetical protein